MLHMNADTSLKSSSDTKEKDISTGYVLMGGRMKETQTERQTTVRKQRQACEQTEKSRLDSSASTMQHLITIHLCGFVYNPLPSKKHTYNRLKQLRCQPDKTDFHIIHIRFELVNLTRSLFVYTFIQL